MQEAHSLDYVTQVFSVRGAFSTCGMASNEGLLIPIVLALTYSR
jgi:hypothetical protein